MIDVRNISKTYNVTKKEEGIRGALKSLVTKETVELKAVNNISFHVDKGEIVGFIGPNGAGKSTTIKMMSGILTPTSGQVLIAGEDITKHRKEVVQNIGVVFGQRTQLNWDLRLSESFELLRHIYRVDKEDYMNVLDTMDEILGIKELLCKPVRQMSLGQRIKGDLVAAMIHSPKVLFLDEPTIGLDVSSKYALRKFIKEINARRGTTIILTTHDLGDIQELCDRIIIINNGELVEDGNLSNIVNRIAPYKTLTVQYFNEKIPLSGIAELIETDGNIAKYRFKKSETTAAKVIEDLSLKASIQDISVEEVRIEEIIRIAYG